MDAPTMPVQSRYVRWLPYWAVLQTDVRQTLRGWVWRTWVLASLAAAVGYLLYRLGVYREAGIVQRASLLVGDLLRWTMLGTGLLVVVLTVGGVSAERGTLADSVLSRGISRYQYFLAKLHSRLFSVVVTFTVLTGGVLLASHFMVQEDVAWDGGLVALAVLGSILAVVVTCGVAVGALTTNPVFGISLLWVVLWAGGFLLSFLPKAYATPDRVLTKLPQILQGMYDIEALGRMAGIGLGAAAVVAFIGMIGFSRTDV
ncbi:MAG TPA: ABC transporter permease [Gemmataceae bacterium]|nr:ABC transporter permease [Gemmataceae bacterium]